MELQLSGSQDRPALRILAPAPLTEALEVVMEAQGRVRWLSASIAIPHPPEQVWPVLTGYDALADFIPNLLKSTLRVDAQGRKLLEQVGGQTFLFLNFSARVVLEMQELPPRELRFALVEGDFQEFEGCWLLRSDPVGTCLTYQLRVQPKPMLPVKAIEKCLKHELSVNLLAIRQQVCQRCGTV